MDFVAVLVLVVMMEFHSDSPMDHPDFWEEEMVSKPSADSNFCFSEKFVKYHTNNFV